LPEPHSKQTPEEGTFDINSSSSLDVLGISSLLNLVNEGIHLFIQGTKVGEFFQSSCAALAPGLNDGFCVNLVDTAEHDCPIPPHPRLYPGFPSWLVAELCPPVGIASRQEEVDIRSSGVVQKSSRLAEFIDEILRAIREDEPLLADIQIDDMLWR
jgi:hypothetical protein